MRLPTRFQLFGFAVAVALVIVLIVWTVRAGWGRVKQLRHDLGEVQIDSFHLAEHIGATILGLDDTLLRFDLRDSPAERARFHTESQQLKEWVAARKGHLHTGAERKILTELQEAYEVYLAGSDRLMAEMAQTSNPASLASSFARVEDQSKRLIELSRKLAEAQRAALQEFVAASHNDAVWLQRLLFILLVLLLTLAGSVAVLVYRGMIAPLRSQLVESHAIIERQEKLASLGTLAAGVAHEIRNPLTAIKVRLFGLMRGLRKESSEGQDAAVISSEISRLERIVKDFLQFARPSEPEFLWIQPERLLREVDDLLRSSLQEQSIRLQLEPGDAALVRGDPQQLKQVLINLVQNAAESIGRDGSIALRALTTVKPLSGRSTPAVVLEVRDTGKGIPPEVQKRLFDPFFTTKEGGTGLGLAIAARIVEKHGGALHYQTQVNRGTTFSVVLPRAQRHETDP